MARVTPGYNFGTTEQVSAQKLRDFIEDASVADVNWSEVDSSIPRFAVVSDTAFSVGPEGSSWYDRVTRQLFVQTRWGPVVLLSPTRIESRRFPINTDSPFTVGFHPPFRCLGFDTSGSGYGGGVSEPAWELRSGVNSTNLGTKVMGIGPQWATAVSESGGPHPRVVIWGTTKVRFGDWNQISGAGQYGGAADADGRFAQAAAVTTDRITAVVMGRSEDNAASQDQASHTGFIFFWPGNFWVV